MLQPFSARFVTFVDQRVWGGEELRALDASGMEGVPVCCPGAQLVHKIPDCHALGNVARNYPPPASAQDNIIRRLCQFQAWQRGGPIENIRHLQQNRGSRIGNHERINLHPCRMGPCEDTQNWSRIGQRKAPSVHQTHVAWMHQKSALHQRLTCVADVRHLRLRQVQVALSLLLIRFSRLGV